VGFLTPLGGASTPSTRALPWFPVVGALVGLGVGVVWDVGDELWPLVVAAALAVVADLALTGLLHVDGLADSADGLLPHLPPERRLAVMAEPTTGAFGVSVVGAVLLLRFAAFAGREPDVVLCVLVWATSRSAMAWSMARQPYARPGGLGEVFRDGPWWPGAVGLAAALAVGLTSVDRAAAVAACWIAALAVVRLGRRRVGGWTGDVLGAAGVVGETVGLLVAAARW
jgi:adenosylcobinamide-GDP ribazoletransferase